MLVLRLRGRLGRKELHARLDKLGAVAAGAHSAASLEEFRLAHHLAKSAFSKKRNIARDIRYEFLLWLSGKTDIRSAMEATAPKGGEDFFVVLLGESGCPEPDAICRLLEAESLPLGLEKQGSPLALERISLSRVKN
jgi:tRNA threonylcarbamoyladenosine modification (KEOPS) complex Cgi121 subunit